MNPTAPIYIPSKGRHDSCMTMRYLDRMGVPYRVIVEAQEFAAYAAALGAEKLLVLDPRYQRDYDACMSLEENQSRGSGPARNFAWDHAQAQGAAWHWVLDDNIAGFARMAPNRRRIQVTDGTIFRCMEDFVQRYRNLVMAGPHYYSFGTTGLRGRLKPFVMNTRLYSCILLRTDIPFRWRCRYNEDTDLSLRILKAGYCTVQFNAFLQRKMTTQTMKGGNTDAFYASEGTLPKSRMLVDLHPDVARVVWKFGRWHHHVNYRPFKHNKLIRARAAEAPEGVNNYGMQLVRLSA